MELRGQTWPRVYNASGARGFDGEGYWFHKIWRPLGLDYKDSCFVAKTTTLYAREGNMPLERGHQPRELLPSCIIVKPLKGVVLNAVGLSGPGSDEVLRQLSLTDVCRERRLMVSFMATEGTRGSRLGETMLFLHKLAHFADDRSDFGDTAVQINLSCPNTKLHPEEIFAEAEELLDSVSHTPIDHIPILLKVNALLSPRAVAEVSRHKRCDGIVVSNSLPWGSLPERIDWEGLFGSEVSPLAHLGGGGLSGAPLLPIVSEWVRKARIEGLSKPLIAGGGILDTTDADRLFSDGAEGFELGSVSILRPWRVKGLIRHINDLFWLGDQ